MNGRGWIGSILLLLCVAGTAAGLARWKFVTLKQAEAASTQQYEPQEAITVAVATERDHRRTTNSVGTVLALRSITLKNELAGTARSVNLVPGQIVEAGAVLVVLDVSVEEAELKAQEAQASLAETSLARMQKASQNKAASELELDRAKAERDVALAQVARTKAVIARKTVRAPFRARVGIADVHPGQYLNEGSLLTTLQGVDPSAHVDFTVSQAVAAGLKEGDRVEVFTDGASAPLFAKIVAVDARVDAATRNAIVRAKVEGAAPSPGASVRVRVPVGASNSVVAVPATALRKAPTGDHVFVIVADKDGKLRAKPRPVVTGALSGDEVLIYSGLQAGEKVAATGSFKLRDGVLVNVAGAPAAQAQTP